MEVSFILTSYKALQSFYRPYKGLKRDLRKEVSIVSIRDGLYFHEKLKQLLSIT